MSGDPRHVSVPPDRATTFFALGYNAAMLSPATVQSFWNEIEKIARVSKTLAREGVEEVVERVAPSWSKRFKDTLEKLRTPGGGAVPAELRKKNLYGKGPQPAATWEKGYVPSRAQIAEFGSAMPRGSVAEALNRVQSGTAKAASVRVAFIEEMKKIAELGFSADEKRVARAVAGAMVGGASTNILFAPITAGLMMAWGAKPAVSFMVANTLKGMTIGALGGALYEGGKKKQAAAWGQDVGRTHGWGTTSSGWSTRYRSAGMENPKPAAKAVVNLSGTQNKNKTRGLGKHMPDATGEANNQRALRRGLSNITTPKTV